MDRAKGLTEDEIFFGNGILSRMEDEPEIGELHEYIKVAYEAVRDCFGESIIDIEKENCGLPEKYDYDLVRMSLHTERLLDILKKKPRHLPAFDIGVATSDLKRGKYVNAAYRIGLSLHENLIEILRQNPKIGKGFTKELENMSPWLAVRNFYHCILRNKLISWSDKRLSDFTEDELEIILGDPETAYAYLKKNLTYNHKKEYFDFMKLSENSELHGKLNVFIFWIDDYFTMRDPGEDGYRKCSKESLGKLSRILAEKIAEIGESFFDPRHIGKDSERLEYLKKKRRYSELVQLQGELSKRYFLSEYLEKGIITKSYHDYLHNTKASWEALKELFYPSRIKKKAADLLKESNQSKTLAAEVQKAIDTILQYPPRQGYRLMRNLEMTVWSVNIVLRSQKQKGIGISMRGLEKLSFEVVGVGEDVSIGDGKL